MKSMFSYCLKLLLILLSLSFFPTLSNASNQTPFNQITFFGDSLTDNGNFFKVSLGLMPKSPPYFHGRFSNGVTWAEVVSEFFAKNHVKSANYALGGETTVFHNPFEGFLPYTLTSSVEDYLFHNALNDKSHNLYIIWIGANDYIPQKTFDEKLVDNVITTMNDNIEKLIKNKGMNFLVVNLPDLSLTPRGRASSNAKILAQYSAVHNEKLNAAISALKNKHPEIALFIYDINDLFNQMVADPEVFNKQYNTHITNTSTGCWDGGYTAQQMLQDNMSIKAELDQKAKLNGLGKNIDTTNLANAITVNPDLAVTYAVTKSYEHGATACVNPDENLFWDSLHPSAVTHNLLALRFIDFINEHYTRA
ncbi:MAG: SGNH/GDSL hydrolase family protein [Gammaproteobacteria bacterium]|nr:SGNH/GDSL hydrolase family protein [Gammaproteobacteria bacterium]